MSDENDKRVHNGFLADLNAICDKWRVVAIHTYKGDTWAFFDEDGPRDLAMDEKQWREPKIALKTYEK